MKWPFVSREQHDQQVAMTEFYRAGNEKILGWYNAERAKNDALTERLLSLKMAGAVEIPDLSTTSGGAVFHVAHEVAPDPMRQVIADRCGANYRLRALMLRQLATDRAAGLSDEEILSAIENGHSSDGVPS